MRSRKHTCFITIIAVIASICLQACSSYDEPMVHEHTPDYIDPAVLEISEIRAKEGGEKAIRYIDSLRAIYFNKSVSDRFYILYLYADTYNRDGDREKTLRYTDSIIELFDSNSPKNFAYNNYVWAYYFKADRELEVRKLDRAHEYYYKALSMANKYNDRCGIGYYYLRIGMIIFQTEQYADAAEYFKESYNNGRGCEQTFGYFNREQRLLNNIGLCYERLGIYDSSLVYYHKALDFIETGYDIFPEKHYRLLNVAKAVVQGNLGGVYTRLNKTDEVEQILKESIATNSDILYEPIDAQYTRVKLAYLYLHTNRIADAKSVLDTIKYIDDTLGNDVVLTRWHNVMWEYWQIKGNTQKAYEHLSTHTRRLAKSRKAQFNFSLANIDNRVKNLAQSYKITALENKASLRETYLIAASVIAIFAVVIVILVIQNLRRSTQHVQVLQEMNDTVNEQSRQLKKALAELEDAGEEKDRILKAVSHDMRSPINSALALVDLLTNESDNLTNEQKEYMQLIKVSSEHALNLTKDLLEVVTLNTKKVEKQLTDITAELEERVKLLNFKAQEKKQQVKFSAPANNISANVNKEKLLRVVSNLVNNAMKFSPDESFIDITLSATKADMLITVRDNGIGIPEDIESKVFDLFSDAKRYGTSGEQPFGLGLSISRQIVEAHSGKIWFESQEDEGTTFFVEIPLNG